MAIDTTTRPRTTRSLILRILWILFLLGIFAWTFVFGWFIGSLLPAFSKNSVVFHSPSGKRCAIIIKDDVQPKASLLFVRIYEGRESFGLKRYGLVHAADSGCSGRMRWEASWKDDSTFVIDSADIGTVTWTFDGSQWTRTPPEERWDE
jgi:hypothetical protein